MFMGRIIAKIQRTSSGKVVVMFFGPAMLIYFIMLLYTIPLVESYVPGMKLFDLSPAGYTIEYSLQLLGTLGDIGRDKYLHLQLPLDFIYPGLFAVSCSLLLSWLLKKSVNTNSNAFYLCFTPVAAGLFDYLENIFIFDMLTSYPNVNEIVVVAASTFTILKSIFTTVFFISLTVAVILFWRRKHIIRSVQ
jgi:hypothetical protein